MLLLDLWRALPKSTKNAIVALVIFFGWKRVARMWRRISSWNSTWRGVLGSVVLKLPAAKKEYRKEILKQLDSTREKVRTHLLNFVADVNGLCMSV